MEQLTEINTVLPNLEIREPLEFEKKIKTRNNNEIKIDGKKNNERKDSGDKDSKKQNDKKGSNDNKNED